MIGNGDLNIESNDIWLFNAPLPYMQHYGWGDNQSTACSENQTLPIVAVVGAPLVLQ